MARRQANRTRNGGFKKNAFRGFLGVRERIAFKKWSGPGIWRKAVSEVWMKAAAHLRDGIQELLKASMRCSNQQGVIGIQEYAEVAFLLQLLGFRTELPKRVLYHNCHQHDEQKRREWTPLRDPRSLFPFGRAILTACNFEAAF